MDNVEYVRGSRKLLEPEASGVTPIVSQSLKLFADATTPHCIAATRKFMIYNKVPGTIKAIQRITSKATDFALAAPLLHAVALHPDSDTFVLTTKDGKVTLVKITEAPNQDVTVEAVETYNVADAFAAVVQQRPGTTHSPTEPRANKQLVVFTTAGTVAVVLKADQAGVAPTTVKLGNCASPVSATCGQGVVAFTSKNRVVVQSVEKLGSDVLSKPWLPHGDDPVDFVYIPRREMADASIPIITSAANEVRFWTLGKTAATLHQTAALVDDAANKPKGPMFKAVDADEDFLFIVDGASGNAIVMELANSTTSLSVERITEWALGEQIVSVAPIYRKAAAAAGAATRHELTLVARTASGVKRFPFDQARLSGPSNIGAEASSAAAAGASASGSPAAAAGSSSGHITAPGSSVELLKKWGLDKTPTQPSPAQMAPSGFTHITSTTGGQTTTKTSFDPRAVLDALNEQQRGFAEVLRAFDATIVTMERLANERLGVLRQGQADAQAMGEASARQVAAGIFANVPQGGGPGAGDVAINQDVLMGFTSSVTEAATITVQQALAAGLKHHVANAVDRAQQIVANNTEKDAVSLPKLSSLPSMQALSEMLDKVQASQNELFRRQKEQDQAKYRNIVRAVQDKVAKQTASTLHYMKELNAEIQGLKGDLSDFKTGPAAAFDHHESDEQIYQAAIRLAESGQWQQALLKATSAGKASLLLRYLETDFIKVNRESVAPEAAASVPLFLAVIQQLTADMDENAGELPMRTEWLHAFVLAFDEVVESKKDAALNQQLKAAQVHISNVVDSVNSALEKHKTAIDRGTRRALTVIKKALEVHGM